jgi:hypothetical protein
MAAHNVVDSNYTCIPNVTSTIVSTNVSDRNPGKADIVKSPWFLGITITFGVLFFSFIIGATVLIGLLVATCTSKRRLQLELQQLKVIMNPVYEDLDIESNTNKNFSGCSNVHNDIPCEISNSMYV